jgi:hypothetical protein
MAGLSYGAGPGGLVRMPEAGPLGHWRPMLEANERCPRLDLDRGLEAGAAAALPFDPFLERDQRPGVQDPANPDPEQAGGPEQRPPTRAAIRQTAGSRCLPVRLPPQELDVASWPEYDQLRPFWPQRCRHALPVPIHASGSTTRLGAPPGGLRGPGGPDHQQAGPLFGQ